MQSLSNLSKYAPEVLQAKLQLHMARNSTEESPSRKRTRPRSNKHSESNAKALKKQFLAVESVERKLRASKAQNLNAHASQDLLFYSLKGNSNRASTLTFDPVVVHKNPGLQRHRRAETYHDDTNEK